MAHIAIIGPGAIGGVLAGRLSQDSRHRLTLAVRTAFERLVLQTPEGEEIVSHPHLLTDPSQTTSPVDWVLVTTKAYDVEGTVRWLRALTNESTRVAIIQNGVEHVERFAPYFGAERLLPVMIDLPTERKTPGVMRQRGPGRMAVPESKHGAEFADLFANTPLTVTQDADFKSQVWRKLCVNCAGALNAVMLKPAVITRHDGVADIMRALIRECIAVGRAEGAKLDDSIADTVIAGYRSAAPDSMNSLHADRAAGRPMETDARNGVIVRLGRKHGIATPMNQMMVAMLEAAAL